MEEEGAVTAVHSTVEGSVAEDHDEARVCFVLEETSGYMEPSLCLLAVAHTIISFCCIIGYYCLKVPASPHTLNAFIALLLMRY